MWGDVSTCTREVVLWWWSLVWERCVCVCIYLEMSTGEPGKVKEWVGDGRAEEDAKETRLLDKGVHQMLRRGGMVDKRGSKKGGIVKGVGERAGRHEMCDRVTQKQNHTVCSNASKPWRGPGDYCHPPSSSGAGPPGLRHRQSRGFQMLLNEIEEGEFET